MSKINDQNYLEKMFIDQAKPALDRHSGGGEPAVIEPLEIMENGTYTAPEGVDGYSPVTVNVAASESAPKSLFAKIVDKSVTNVTAEELGDIIIIPSSAFKKCYRLRSIEIPDTVTSIDITAFEGTGLTSITIPENVTSIHNQAFQGSYKLVEVINKSSLSLTLGQSPFKYAKEIHSGPSKIVNKGGFTFYAYDGVNYLMGPGDDRQEPILPDRYNGELYNVHDYAFYGNDQLTSVTIGDGVQSIGRSAFFACKNMTSVSIGRNVKSIGAGAFNGELIKTLNIKDVASWCDIEFAQMNSNPLYCTSGPYTSLYVDGVLATSLEIPDGVERISAYAFLKCPAVDAITFPETLTSIGNHAFYEVQHIKNGKLTIPSRVAEIGNSAFYIGSSIDYTFLSETPPTIGSNTFYSTYVRSITVPKGCSDAYKSATNWSNLASKIKEAAE